MIGPKRPSPSPLLVRRLPRWLRGLVAVFLFVITIVVFPRWWCGRDAAIWLRSDEELVLAHAREVAATVRRGVSADEFTHAGALFRHEWQFGTYQMGALGLLQACLAHPQHRAELLPAAELAIDALLSERVRAFDARQWGEDPLESLDGTHGHAAYLGYTNLALGLHRRAVGDSRFAALHDRITEALARRVLASRQGILETYPGESYPIDNAAVYSSILMHARVTGAAQPGIAALARARFAGSWREPISGLLYQAIDGRDGLPLDRARASGTALAAAFLAYADREIASELLAAVRTRCVGEILGFGFVREYDRDPPSGGGDVDSGPLILGISPSATGFTLAAARACDDHRLFTALYRTAYLTGVPVTDGDRRRFITGGPIGNAILLAMLTFPEDLP